MESLDLEELEREHCNYQSPVDYRNVIQLAKWELDFGDCEILCITYHPSPQNLLDRPQSPSLEQQAPHVGEHTKPSAPAHVPSTVTTPVCHGGSASVAVLCDTARAGNSQKRGNAGTFIFNCQKGCVISVNGICGTKCAITLTYIES